MGTPGPRDMVPQFPNILETLGPPISYDIRDPFMKLGTPMFFVVVVVVIILLNFAITTQ